MISHKLVSHLYGRDTHTGNKHTSRFDPWNSMIKQKQVSHLYGRDTHIGDKHMSRFVPCN